jgi:pimeloyl-ACP methyl ester carboxylesterase
MYYLPGADPSTIKADIATKETATYEDIATLPAALDPSITAKIHVPVLIVDGQEDALSCASDATDCSSSATLAAAEQPLYPNTHVDTFVVPDAGHAVTLHRDAPLTYSVMLGWSLWHLPPGSR